MILDLGMSLLVTFETTRKGLETESVSNMCF